MKVSKSDVTKAIERESSNRMAQVLNKYRSNEQKKSSSGMTSQQAIDLLGSLATTYYSLRDKELYVIADVFSIDDDVVRNGATLAHGWKVATECALASGLYVPATSDVMLQGNTLHDRARLTANSRFVSEKLRFQSIWIERFREAERLLETDSETAVGMIDDIVAQYREYAEIRQARIEALRKATDKSDKRMAYVAADKRIDALYGRVSA